MNSNVVLKLLLWPMALIVDYRTVMHSRDSPTLCVLLNAWQMETMKSA